MPGTALSIVVSPINTPLVAAAPTELPATDDISLWLDSAQEIYTDAGGTTPATDDDDRIELWRDQSGNGWDFTTTGSDTRPVLLTSFGGIRSVFFGLDPSNELEATWLWNEDFALIDGVEWSFAILFIPGSAAAYVRNIVQDLALNDKSVQINTSEQLELLNDQSHANAKTLQGTTVLAGDQPRVVSGRVSGSIGYALRLDDVAEDTDTGTPSMAWSGCMLGQETNPANVYIAEIVIWHRALTDEELSAASQYLVDKYGL